VLFPAFEQASGMSGGPTWVMRQEHQRMLAMLEEIASAIATRNAQDFRALVQAFVGLMTAHSMKEERVLYPMCDEALPDIDGEKLSEMVSHQ
jgi:hemerythrin-like domain-containing protein